MKRRSPVRPRLEPDPTSLGFDNRPADREADSHSSLFRRDERLEQSLDNGFVDACPGVLHGDRHEIVRTRPRANGEEAYRAIEHGIDGIADEIGEHLLNLDAIDEHGVGFWIETDLDLDPMFPRTDESQGVGLGDQPRQGFDSLFRFTGSNEVPSVTLPSAPLTIPSIFIDRRARIASSFSIAWRLGRVMSWLSAAAIAGEA